MLQDFSDCECRLSDSCPSHGSLLAQNKALLEACKIAESFGHKSGCASMSSCLLDSYACNCGMTFIKAAIAAAEEAG